MPILYFTCGIPCECKRITKRKRTNTNFACEIAYPCRTEVIYDDDGKVFYSCIRHSGRELYLEFYRNGLLCSREPRSRTTYARIVDHGLAKFYRSGMLHKEILRVDGEERDRKDFKHSRLTFRTFPTENFI